jgi:radical SAM-linked protein
MQRLWERLLRRSQLPLAYSQGFNPHIRMSLAVPLSVGMTSSAEYLEIEMTTLLKPQEITAALQPVIPQGLDIMEIRLSPYKEALGAKASLLEYSVEVHGIELARAELDRIIVDFLDVKEKIVLKTTKNGTRELNIRPFVNKLFIDEYKEGTLFLKLQLTTSPQGSVKTEEVLQAVGIPAKQIILHRSAVYFKTTQGEYYLP